MSDLLGQAVFEDQEILLFQIEDGAALVVQGEHFNRYQVNLYANGYWLFWLVLSKAKGMESEYQEAQYEYGTVHETSFSLLIHSNTNSFELIGIITAMPIFEYRCKKCDHEFEKIVFNSTAGIVCPKCSGKETEKLLSGFAVQGGGSSSTKASAAPAGCGSGGFR